MSQRLEHLEPSKSISAKSRRVSFDLSGQQADLESSASAVLVPTVAPNETTPLDVIDPDSDRVFFEDAYYTTPANVKINYPFFEVGLTGAFLMSDPELQNMLCSYGGLVKLHKQFWHIQAPELFKKVSSVLPPEKHAEVRKLCDKVVV